jgi:ABC-type glycerol-3-phosphate transport system substrate-binding protein
MRVHRSLISFLCLLATVLAACAPSSKPAAQSSGPNSWPSTPQAIAAYQGADRQQMLEAGAKEEATITWYTVLAGDIVDALAQGFQQKYPYIKVDANRPSGTRAIFTKVNQES